MEVDSDTRNRVAAITRFGKKELAMKTRSMAILTTMSLAVLLTAPSSGATTPLPVSEPLFSLSYARTLKCNSQQTSNHDNALTGSPIVVHHFGFVIVGDAERPLHHPRARITANLAVVRANDLSN
jgi:hypothetical protein